MMPSFSMRQPQQQQSLAAVNNAYLLSLSQQGNMGLNHSALSEQASAQAAMQNIAEAQNLEVPKVNFFPSRNPDSRKARRQDMKQAYKLLTPSKRSIINPRRFLLGRKYRYNKQSHICVIDGCDCSALIQYDNLYDKINDDDTGLSLWDMYWKNSVTGEAEAFVAMDRVSSGRKMRGTYCPEHLHLFHLLCKWEREEEKEKEATSGRFRDKVKKGINIVTIPISTIKKKDTMSPEMLEKYEPFLDELNKDSRKTKGISIHHYQNPLTGLNDITTITFDLRMFQHEMDLMKQPTPEFSAMLNQHMNENTQTEQPLPIGE